MKEFYKVVEEIRIQKDLEIFRDIYKNQRKKLVIFGAGDCGHNVYRTLQNEEIEIECFCDNNQSGHLDEKTGIKILCPEDLSKMKDHTIVLICILNRKANRSVYKQLLEQGFNENQLLDMGEYFYRLPVEYLDEHMENYRKAYELFDEEHSKKVFLAKMKREFLISDIKEIVSPCEEMYFDEMVKLTDHEVFIDCGGFVGDSSIMFLKKCKGKYKDIVIFEPELCKKKEIERNMAGKAYELYQTGVWSECTKLYFEALESDASHLSERESQYVVDVASLDAAVYDKKPTFIKMDIEGAEQEALKGCEKILKEYKPKLAVCVYHKPDDLFRIPLFIKEVNPEYQLFLRQYANSRTETVLYAL